MKEIRITVRCLNSPTVHSKVVRVKARLGRRKAEELAELLDGTSLAYVHAPGAGSPIGRCVVCGGECEAEVSVVVDAVEQLPSCEEAVERAARREKAAERGLGYALSAEESGGARS